METKIARKVLEHALKIISYMMIILAIISLAENLIKYKHPSIPTNIMLIMEVCCIISFFYSYYLFAKKKEHAALFIVLPLTIFFLYLTAISSYANPIASYGTISCIIMLLTIEIRPRTRVYLITGAIITALSIVTLQIFKIIPMEPLLEINSLLDSLATITNIIIFYSCIALSLYIYHVRTLSKGTLERVLRQYEDVLSFAVKKYDYTDREADVARCIIQRMSYNEISLRLNISISTVKYHSRNLLEKSGIESKANYYEILLDRYKPLTKVIKEVTQ